MDTHLTGLPTAAMAENFRWRFGFTLNNLIDYGFRLASYAHNAPSGKLLRHVCLRIQKTDLLDSDFFFPMKSLFDQVSLARAECVNKYLEQPDNESTELIIAEIKTLKALFPAVLDWPVKQLTYEDFNLIHVAIVQHTNPIIAGANHNYNDTVN